MWTRSSYGGKSNIFLDGLLSIHLKTKTNGQIEDAAVLGKVFPRLLCRIQIAPSCMHESIRYGRATDTQATFRINQGG